jgi:1-phosphofructokinase
MTVDLATVTLNPAIDRTVTIENFTAGKVNRAGEVRSNPGGKGVNVASALADFGLCVSVTGFLGRENAADFEKLFAQKGIEDRFVRIDGQTRVGIKIVDPVRNDTTDINFPGPAPTSGDLASLRERLEAIDARWFVLAGSLPLGVEATFYGDLVTLLKSRGCKVALDTSGESLEKALKSGPDLIKPNIHELEALLGDRLEGEEAVVSAAQRLVAGGIELVIVSMGPEGACYVTADECLVARPPDVEVRSTVGAGDAMVAGTVAGRLRDLSLGDCARMGTAFSLEALSRIESGISSPDAIAIAMDTVTLSSKKP